MILAIECGCAECHSGDTEPLIEARTFDSMDVAKAHYANERWLHYIYAEGIVRWTPHPQGGEHVVVGQGSVWLRPL